MRKCYSVKISHIRAQIEFCDFWDFCPQNALWSNLAKIFPGQCQFTKKKFGEIGSFLGKKYAATCTLLQLEFFAL